MKPGGKLLLGDIIEPKTPLIGHVTTFLRFAWQNGFFVPAVIGLARNFMSPYRKLRRDAGYTCYTESEMLGLLNANGLVGERLTSNIAGKKKNKRKNKQKKKKKKKKRKPPPPPQPSCVPRICQQGGAHDAA